MVKYNGKKIVYTFRYGKYLTNKVKILCIVFAVLFLAAIVSLFVWDYLCNTNGEERRTLGIIFMLVVLIAVIIYGWRRQRRITADIKKWLSDENLFEVAAIPYEAAKQDYRGRHFYKLGIDFESDGNSYKKITSRYEKLSGFYNAVKSEKGKEITFLYSPKYGEVMVFENKQVK